MAVVYGKYDSFLSETFMLEKGKAYDDEDPQVRSLMKRYPDAFGGSPPFQPQIVEQATAAPGETRRVRRDG